MTISEFKYILSDTNGIGSLDTEIITLFNTSSLGTTIDAVALRINEINTLSILQQITTINYKLPGSGPVVNILVTDSILPYRDINKSVVESYYLYEIYPENQRPVIIAPTTGSNGYEEYITDLLLEPASAQTNFNISDYNVLIGTVQESRQSTYVYKLDKTSLSGSGLNPRNLPSILANNAELANIQDSNYTSKSWINPRYEGSALTTLTNGGTDPFIQGTFFEGAFFTNTVQDGSITSASIANTATYRQNFSTGKLDIPKYVVEKLDLGTRFQYSPSASMIEVTSSATPLNKDLFLGDILVFSSSAGFSQEVLQILPPTGSYYLSEFPFPYEYLRRTPTKEVVEITVKRGSSDTKAQTIPINSQLYRVISTKAYDLIGNTITPVKQGKLLIRDTGDILRINSDGLVVSGSNRINYEDL